MIAGRAEMLSSGLLGPLTDQQRRSLEILTTNVERLTQELDALAELIPDSDSPDGPAR